MKSRRSKMKRRSRTACPGAFLLAAALLGAPLSGCAGPCREKIVLPEHRESIRDEADGSIKTGEQNQAQAEIVIVPEPPAPEPEEVENAGANESTGTGSAGRESNGTGSTGTESNGTETESAARRSAADYHAGEVLTAGEVEALGTNTFFYQTAIGESLYRRMNGKSYKSGCPVAPEELCYLRVLHWGYQDEIRVGELVCSRSISEDLLSIFRKLYDARYPIEKMRLIDDYGGDDDRSSSDNNTSCFNYRNVAGTEHLSRHALGIAIDINPLYNPYVVTDAEGNVSCAPENGSRYADRTRFFPYKIDEEDLCCRLFTEAGFTWGGSWQEDPDYMHFSKGSTPET